MVLRVFFGAIFALLKYLKNLPILFFLKMSGFLSQHANFQLKCFVVYVSGSKSTSDKTYCLISRFLKYCVFHK